jgi:Aspartyl protease
VPHLTFPRSPAGLTLTVVIALNANELAKRRAAGSLIPPPLSATAIIDTGSDASSVDGALLRQLGLTAVSHTSTRTVAGQVPVDLFEVSLSIFGPQSTAGPVLVRPQLVVAELPQPLPGIDVLIGMDLLSDCLLIVDGPGRQFTLAF